MRFLLGSLLALPLVSVNAFGDPVPEADANELIPRGGGWRNDDPTCGDRGYDRDIGPYFHSKRKSLRSHEACGERCLKDRKCKSYRVGTGHCALYEADTYVGHCQIVDDG
jgi:hypothetical protein